MALLKLSAINQLKNSVILQRQAVVSDCFNWPAHKAMRPDLFIQISKAEVQVINLVSKLELLYQTCRALSRGIDEQWSFDEQEQATDPLAGIRFVFHAQTEYDLPPIIEQYHELQELAMAYSQHQKARRQLVQGVPQLTDQGEFKFIPRTAFTEAAWAQNEYQQQIADLDVEYCLAGYNQFYQQSMSLLQAQGDAQQTALAMLQLIKAH